MRDNLVQREDAEAYLDSAWTVQVLRGIFLAALLVLGAPLAGGFFNEARVVPIVRLLGLAELLKGLTNIGIVYFQKELRFHKQFLYQLFGTSADLAVAIPAAFILRSAWALVLGMLVANGIRMIASYLIHEYGPRLSLDLDKCKELFDFGKWRFASSLLVFLLTQGDDIFLGRLLGSAALGLYQMAYNISCLPATHITHVISQVTFPAYAKLKSNITSVRGAFIQVIQLTAFLAFPLAAGIACLATPFTELFLGENWLSMVPPLQVLTIWGVIRALEAATSPVWLALGRPQLPTLFQFIRVLLLVGTIYPLTLRWGVLGTSLAIVLESFVVHLVRYTFMARTLQCSPIQLFGQFLIPGMATAIMSLAVLVGSHLVSDVNLIVFSVLILGGAAVYLLTNWIIGALLGKNHLQALIDRMVLGFQGGVER